MKHFLRLFFHRDHLVISVLAVLILCLFYFVSMNISFLSPVARAIKDFSMSDLYYHILWSGNEPEQNDLITLVDVTDLHKRGDIAHTIEQVNQQEPKVLGIDIIFEGVKEDSLGNDSLMNALAMRPSETVSVFKLLDYNANAKVFNNSLHSFFIEDVPIMEGYANVLSNGTNGNVRQFSISRRTRDMEVYSLPAMLYMAAINDTLPFSVKEPDDRMINYVPTTFPVVRYDSIEQRADLIRDHIVLLGTVKEEQDMHYTPIGKMPGLEVQAFSLQTLLSQRDILVVGEGWLMLLAFIFCYLTQFIQYGAVRLAQHRTDTLSIFLSGSFLYLRFVTFAWLGLLAWMGFILYIKCNVYLAMTWIFAPVVLVAEARGLYSAFIKTLCLKHHNRFPCLKKSLYYVKPNLTTGAENEELRVESGTIDAADAEVDNNNSITSQQSNG